MYWVEIDSEDSVIHLLNKTTVPGSETVGSASESMNLKK